MRAPFLVLTPACVLLGIGTAVWQTDRVGFFTAVFAFIGAVAAHISVNAFNEYYDFKSGLDLNTERTPFSGGSGTLPENPDMVRTTLVTAWISFAVTATIGAVFILIRGNALLPLGLAGLLLVFGYTIWFTRHPVLCLVAPGLGFGPLMVMGTHFVLTGDYSWTAFIASLVPFFLVSDLLLLNQFPDVAADRSVGRKHLPITIGRKKSSYVYGLFLLLTYLSLAVGVLFHWLPGKALIGMLTIVLAVPAFIGAYRYHADMEKLLPYMGMNVVINLLTPVLVAVGVFIA
ncbi:MAG: prenyltransferase [Desulfobacterales bacterium]|nr:prenyltransferase [Desulfobacterales bacterium]